MFFKTGKSIIALAVPMIISNVGIIITTVVDTVIVAHYNTNELSYRSAANIIHYFIITIAAGLMQGITITVANSYGKQEFFKCGNYFKQAIVFSIVVGCLGFVIYWYGNSILIMLKQPSSIINGANDVLKVLALGFPACVLYFTAAYFLEAIKKVAVIMWIVAILNIINIAVCYVLVFGKLGFPALGAVGSAIATTLMSYLGAVSLLIYIAVMNARKTFFSKLKQYKLLNKEAYNMLLIGLGIGLTVAAEDLAYTINTIYAGWISKLTLAAYALVMNLFMVITTVAIAIGGATAVIVGNNNGAKNLNGVRVAGLGGIALNVVIMGALSIGLYFYAYVIPAVYTSDLNVINLIIPLIHLLALVVFIDSTQIVLANILRACNLLLLPSVIQLTSYMIIMVGSSYYFAFIMKLGILGLLLGVVVASSTSLILLSIGFILVACKVIKTKV